MTCIDNELAYNPVMKIINIIFLLKRFKQAIISDVTKSDVWCDN